MPDDAQRRFDAVMAEILRHEGGYADHPRDPGGATNMGITRRTLARWRKAASLALVPKAAVRDLGRAEALAIYRAWFWHPSGADRLPPGLDLAVMDFAVNSGPARAVATLQAICGSAADGVFGPATLRGVERAVAERGSAEVIDRLCAARLGFLQRLVLFATFGRGWTRRVAAIRTRAQAMAGNTPSTTAKGEPAMALSGYRTYIVAGLMLLTGIAQILGLDLPALDGSAAGQLVLEALAILFLRKGIKAEIGKGRSVH